jgi:glycosyltransferase involved in cell wall biosynthesis
MINKKIEIWSSYPPPFGGVSIHSMRLFNILKNKYNIVFKNFNGEKDSPKNGIYKVSNQFLEILKHLFIGNRIIHLHSNRILVWMFICFYPRSSKIIVTLHNQNLRKKLSFVKYIIIKLFFKKVKKIILNNDEFAYYLVKKFKIDSEKVIILPAFIEPLPEESEPLPFEIDTFFKKNEITISSFAWKLYKVDNKDVYGIDHIIDAFALLKKNKKSIGLLLIIPIIEDQDHYNNLLAKIDEYDLKGSILIYNKPVRNGFDVWKESNLFIRATMTDIEGISIKEAMSYNTPVIATNVVERPEGVSLYSYGDTKELSKLMEENIQMDGSSLQNISIKNRISEIEQIYNSLLK